jgi:ribosomal protein L16 Arg81 hydroxylase
MEDFQDLFKELEDIKVSQKALAEKETLCKEELMAALKENGLDKQDSPYGNVRIQRRAEKDYGSEIRSMEIALKEAKKLADDMGDYQTLGFKESLVYTLPKDLF